MEENETDFILNQENFAFHRETYSAEYDHRSQKMSWLDKELCPFTKYPINLKLLQENKK